MRSIYYIKSFNDILMNDFLKANSLQKLKTKTFETEKSSKTKVNITN